MSLQSLHYWFILAMRIVAFEISSAQTRINCKMIIYIFPPLTAMRKVSVTIRQLLNLKICLIEKLLKSFASFGNGNHAIFSQPMELAEPNVTKNPSL